MPDDLIYPNGVNGLTGGYLSPPVERSRLAALAGEPGEDPELAGELARLGDRLRQPTFGLPFDVGPRTRRRGRLGGRLQRRTRTTRCGGRRRPDRAPARRRSATTKSRCSTTSRASGGRSGSCRHGTAPGNVDRRRSRTTSCSSAGRTRIPFGFQYLLGVEYAVGRLTSTTPTATSATSRAARSTTSGRAGRPGRDGDLLRHAAPRRRRHAALGRLARDAAGRQLPRRRAGSAGRARPPHRPPWWASRRRRTRWRQILAGTGPSAGRRCSSRPPTAWAAGLPGTPTRPARHGALLCQDWPGVGRIVAGALLRGRRPPGGCRRARAGRLLLRLLRGRHARAEDAFAHVPGAAAAAARGRAVRRRAAEGAPLPPGRAARSRSSATSTGPGATRSCRAGRRSCCRSRTRSGGSCSASRSATR